jgi:uncharacterized protein YidB (DUF937 family)
MGLLEDILGQVVSNPNSKNSSPANRPSVSRPAPPGTTGGDQLTNMLGSLLGADKQDASPIILAIMKFIQSQGGISGILAKFQQHGMSRQAESWVSTGKNETITPQQVEQVFDRGAINQLAQSMNTTPEKATNTLADFLPELLNQFSPDGKVPEDDGNILASVLGMLGHK